jgi:hypothetical protein
LHTALRVPLYLKLPVARDCGFVRLPVTFLVIRMALTPLAATVTDGLGVCGVPVDLPAMVFTAAATLAVWLAADALVRAEL